MELFAVLRVLWSRRLLLIPGVVFALAVAWLLASRPAAPAPFATASIVLDTRPSLFASPAPDGADTLGWRAQMLSQLLTTDDVRERVARQLEVPTEAVRVVNAVLSEPLKPTAVARTATKADGRGAPPFLATVSVDRDLGLLRISGAAPDPAAAGRLVSAVIDAAALVGRRSAEAARTTPTPTPAPDAEATPAATPEYGLGVPRETKTIQGFTLVEGTVRTGVVPSPSKALVAPLAAMTVLVLWAGFVLALNWLLGAWRSAPRSAGA